MTRRQRELAAWLEKGATLHPVAPRPRRGRRAGRSTSRRWILRKPGAMEFEDPGGAYLVTKHVLARVALAFAATGSPLEFVNDPALGLTYRARQSPCR